MVKNRSYFVGAAVGVRRSVFLLGGGGVLDFCFFVKPFQRVSVKSVSFVIGLVSVYGDVIKVYVLYHSPTHETDCRPTADPTQYYITPTRAKIGRSWTVLEYKSGGVTGMSEIVEENLGHEKWQDSGKRGLAGKCSQENHVGWIIVLIMDIQETFYK